VLFRSPIPKHSYMLPPESSRAGLEPFLYKLMGFFSYVSEMSREAGIRYWSEVHGSMITQLPGLRSHEQNDALGWLPYLNEAPATELPFHGCVIQSYPDRAALHAAMASAEWTSVMEDGPKFIDIETARMGPVQERVLKDGPRGPFKVVARMHSLEGVPVAEVADFWAQSHSALAQSGGCTRIRENRTISDAEWNLPAGRVGEYWFTSEAHYVSALESPAWKSLAARAGTYADLQLSGAVAVSERVLGPA